MYGAPWCPDCRRAKKFLGEHQIAYDWIGIEEDKERLRFVERAQNGGRTIPMLVFADGSQLAEPSSEELARKLGLDLEASQEFYDMAIIGGGPAGRTAVIYAAREGIDAIVIDRGSLGGQAGVTDRIENFPGFPDGIGGAELAERFVTQVQRSGGELLEAVGIEDPEADVDDVALHLSTGQKLCARAPC